MWIHIWRLVIRLEGFSSVGVALIVLLALVVRRVASIVLIYGLEKVLDVFVVGDVRFGFVWYRVSMLAASLSLAGVAVT